MPVSGPILTDWAQLELYSDSPLLVDEDFSWSEPLPRRPSQRRLSAWTPRRHEARRVDVRPPHRGHRADDGWDQPALGADRGGWDQPAADAAWGDSDAAWGDSRSDPDRSETRPQRTRLGEIAPQRTRWNALAPQGGGSTPQVDNRHTVLITGHGDERYALTQRRRRRRDTLPFHQRAGFSPDRTAMWAVLLCIALLLGCVAH